MTQQNRDNLWNKIRAGLEKTRHNITERIDKVLSSFGIVNEGLFESLEEILLTSDIGTKVTSDIMQCLRERTKSEKLIHAAEIKEVMKEELLQVLGEKPPGIDITKAPAVILVVGVNGTGKTTSIAKLAYYLKMQEKSVLLAAGDTFRAAAGDQLEIWAQRAGVGIVKNTEGADPASVIFDAIQSAKAQRYDVLICDTAGRIHTKKNLTEELKKISRVIERELPASSKETLLVLDAGAGQNAISQAEAFSEAIDLTGIILTKMDGTAKGGVIFSIKSQLNIPIKFIGVGEGLDDLKEFDPEMFVKALFE